MPEKKIDPVTIGKRLRELRGDVPRSVIARKLGLSYSALNYFEHGERVPRDETKVQIAEFYGKSVQEIFFDF